MTFIPQSSFFMFHKRMREWNYETEKAGDYMNCIRMCEDVTTITTMNEDNKKNDNNYTSTDLRAPNLRSFDDNSDWISS